MHSARAQCMYNVWDVILDNSYLKNLRMDLMKLQSWTEEILTTSKYMWTCED